MAGDEAPKKSKAELKKERREKQERERAAKAARKEDEMRKGDGRSKKGQTKVQMPATIQADNPQVIKKHTQQLLRQHVQRHADEQKKVAFVKHLHQYDRNVPITKSVGFGSNAVHPAVRKLGLKYSQDVICGSSARCNALIKALIKMTRDMKTPKDKEFKLHFDVKIKQAINFLEQCRPKTISMGNMIKHLREHWVNLERDVAEDEGKRVLVECLENYAKMIHMAGAVIVESTVAQIKNGDRILTYGHSRLVEQSLIAAHNEGKQFTVVVVDSRPKVNGLSLVKILVKNNIKCSYCFISHISNVMHHVDKVITGVQSVFSNGYVLGSIGIATISMVAKSYNVPFIVCCEVYKLSNHSQTDSFTKNDLGDPRDVLTPHDPNCKKVILKEMWQGNENLLAINMTYEVTPPKFVSVLVTELGEFTAISVPAVIKVAQQAVTS